MEVWQLSTTHLLCAGTGCLGELAQTEEYHEGWVCIFGEYLLLGWLVFLMFPLHKGKHTHTHTLQWGGFFISSEEDLTGSCTTLTVWVLVLYKESVLVWPSPSADLFSSTLQEMALRMKHGPRRTWRSPAPGWAWKTLNLAWTESQGGLHC